MHGCRCATIQGVSGEVGSLRRTAISPAPSAGAHDPRFAHRLDPKRAQFRVYDKGQTLPWFWTVCDSCEELVAGGNDGELLRLMIEKDDAADRILEAASITAFRAADLGADPLEDA